MSNTGDTYKHGFKTPDGYFEDFEARVFDESSISKLPDTSGFKVPDGYFEAFDAAKLLTAASAKESPKVIQLFRNNYVRYTAAIAASVLLMLSIVRDNTSGIGSIDDIELTAISEYIEDEDVDFDTFDVIALLQDEELTNLNTQNQYVTDEILEAYLLEALDDATLLTE